MVNTTMDPINVEKIKLELTKIKDEDGKNNYTEFADKSKFKLDAVGLWEYIEGDRDKEPVIPDLVEGKTIKGKDATGAEHTITTDGNAAEVAKAKKDAVPWWNMSKMVLTLIVDAVPSDKMHIVRGCKTAKEAWVALRQHYKPANQIRATHMKTQLLSHIYKPDETPMQWLSKMQEMYNELSDLDPTGKMMPDEQFARQLRVRVREVVEILLSN